MIKLLLQRQKKWDVRFLDLAKKISEWSHDPSTKVGAVIANEDNKILSHGYNGFPRGVDDSKKRYEDRPLKLKLVCHAERNALDNAHYDVSGAILYSTLFTCNECAKSIIQRGIKKVVSPTPVLDERGDIYNWEEAKLMYREAGVKVLFIDQ